jgi:hypothetical protein
VVGSPFCPSVKEHNGADMGLSEWQRAYREALVERDPGKLQDKIARAEAMILSRVRSLVQEPESAAERRAMSDALCHLRLLGLEESELADEDWE